jgi:hypothetical protein
MFMKGYRMRASRRVGGYHPWTVILLGILGLASFCLCFWYVGIPAFCSYELRFSPPNVDFAPLQQLAWTSGSDNVGDILNLEVLDEFEEVAGSHWVEGSLYIQKDDSHYADLSVEIYLVPPAADAEARFRNECRQEWADADMSEFLFGTKDESEFCISYIQPLRADSFGLCLPVGYKSFTVFRKDNLIITISERTSDKTSTFKDLAIEQLADKNRP